MCICIYRGVYIYVYIYKHIYIYTESYSTLKGDPQDRSDEEILKQPEIPRIFHENNIGAGMICT